VNWLEQLWAYVVLGASAMLAEEAAPLIGGLAAHNGRLSPLPVVISIGVGTWSATVGLYYLGRWKDRWVRKRFPRLRGFLLRAFKVVRRHPWRASLAVRWVFGLRIAVPIACGAARVPAPLFIVASAISCFTWAAVFTALGWIFGDAAQRVLRHVHRYDTWIIAVLILSSALGWYLARKRRQRLERRAVEVIAGRDDEIIPEERKGI
jgi:membrane protein DedA with SNARE-associated domain